MWICQRCHTENHDSSAVCAACGTQRAAGRFAPPVQSRPGRGTQPPRVTVPNPQERTERPEPMEPIGRGGYQADEPERKTRRKKRSPLIKLAKTAGILLLILLPAFTALLAVTQYEALASALVPILTGAEGRPILGMICYVLLSLTAVLLSALPGLWTLLLAKEVIGEE